MLSAGLDQSARIDKSARDYSGERRDDLGVRDHRFELVHFRFRFKVLALSDIDVLARDQPRIAFPDLLEALIGQVLNFQIGARACEPLLKLGHFDYGKDLSFFYPVALIN